MLDFRKNDENAQSSFVINDIARSDQINSFLNMSSSFMPVLSIPRLSSQPLRAH